MNETRPNEYLAPMLDRMREAVDDYPLLPGLVYRSPYDFVLDHGSEYRVTPFNDEYRFGIQRHCFANSFILAASGLHKYIEGFALAPTGEIFLHAWNVTIGGELIDCTWENMGLAYYGVEFSYQRADDALWNGDACVLNDEHRNYPVLQKRWTGEDYSLNWPPSDRIDFLRMQHLPETTPSSVREYLDCQLVDGILTEVQRNS